MSHSHSTGHNCSRHGYQPATLTPTDEAKGQQQQRDLQAAEPASQQLLHGLEVIQTIQSMDHAVPLVAKKPTLVRVYFKFRWPFQVKVSGVLQASWRPNQSAPYITRTISSSDYLRVNANTDIPLSEQRKDLKKSLNFVLPSAVRQAGQCTLQLLRLEVHLVFSGRSFKVPVNIPKSSQSTQTVQFQETPPLRLRMLGIRYRTADGSSYEPSGIDYALIQSWLKRAYPIADLEWTQTVVNAPSTWPFNASAINAFTRGIRRREVGNGVDARTHYYALVSNGGGFMRGLASGIPNTPDPSTVASGPTGPNWSWDTDGSFGDWYTGHELGHTLGRFHAEFCGAQGGQTYPFSNGQLSNADEKFVGLDYGDLGNSISQQALPGVEWHDVMTYCPNQWLSSFTYTGIHERLIAENALPAGIAGATPVASARALNAPTPTIHVLATVNLTQKSGQFQHVTAANDLEPDEPQSPADNAPAFTLKLYRQNGELVREQAANFYPDSCRDDEQETGIVDMVIPSDPDGATLELLMADQVIDTFTRAATVAPVRHIRSTVAAEGAALRGLSPATLTIEWDAAAAAAGVSRSLREPTSGISYLVEVSKDGGASWETAGFDQSQTNLEIDPSFFEEVDQIQVRVTSSDGFSAQTTTQTIDLG